LQLSKPVLYFLFFGISLVVTINLLAFKFFILLRYSLVTSNVVGDIKSWTLLKLSDRIRFSILTTVLTFAYTLYLHLSLNFLGQYWYIITAPLATFVSSYFFGITLIKGRFWMIYILPLSAALTLLSHFLNVLILYVFLVITGFFCSPDNDDHGIIGFIILMIYGSQMFMIYGSWISLFNGGLVSFIIFLLSGTLMQVTASRFKTEDISEENDQRHANNHGRENNTTGNST